MDALQHSKTESNHQTKQHHNTTRAMRSYYKTLDTTIAHYNQQQHTQHAATTTHEFSQQRIQGKRQSRISHISPLLLLQPNSRHLDEISSKQFLCNLAWTNNRSHQETSAKVIGNSQRTHAPTITEHTINKTSTNQTKQQYERCQPRAHTHCFSHHL